jgi:hypothetical protein
VKAEKSSTTQTDVRFFIFLGILALHIESQSDFPMICTSEIVREAEVRSAWPTPRQLGCDTLVWKEHRMGKAKHSAEQIVNLLRQIAVASANGKTH